MPDGRIITKAISADARFNAMSRDARLLFVMTIPHLDRDGIIDGRPRILWATVCPLEDDWMYTIDTLVDEWVAQGIVLRYHHDDTPFLFFYNFRKHQPGLRYRRESDMGHPCPPGYIRTDDGLQLDTTESQPQTQTDTASRPTTRQEDPDPAQGSTQPIATHNSPDPGNPDALLRTYSPEQLRCAAWQLGSLLGLHLDWTGWDGWLNRQDAPTLAALLRWIQHYGDLPAHRMDKITNMPGILRTHIRKRDRPRLTGQQEAHLARTIQRAITLVQHAEATNNALQATP